MNKHYLFFLFLFTLLFLNIYQISAREVFQKKGENSKVVEIPFEYVKGFIVLKAKVNGVEGQIPTILTLLKKLLLH